MMEEYVIQLMKYDLKTYINYLSEHPIKAEITSRDITQLSSIDDCTINVCIIMIQCGNKELTLIEIASKLYGKDSYKNTIVALTKYGKNQVKTACQMRLTILKMIFGFYLESDMYLVHLQEKLRINIFRLIC